MKPVRIHQPGTPTTAEPPDGLTALADTIQNSVIVRSGVTTTADGRWALYVTVPANATVPIEDVETLAKGYPVVYEAEPSEPPQARPAKPNRRRS